MLELRVLDSDPDLDGLAIFVLGSDLLDVVELGNCLLWFLTSLQLLVLLYNLISLLQGS